ncbi:protein of unknown function [Mucilaginibacter lappiensis]|uniref:DUF4145 domain-containing protein n=1 Tax=Mucilaginibacter lappiensis TaxID=354630 RepID=A0ABR6PRA0_9SPHI|nr:DUF4145 domain-containing protein [Mucilaginibacter lappiensis]MBB6112302.1 hypothetical protein [Mucilaginibacter lappiensis]SIR97403.1 protein of unknown function [Mucilaginibacter lappiensis]
MPLDKEFWKKLSFSDDNFPDIMCPVCNKGYLKPIKDGLIKEETKDSINARDDIDWEHQWINFRFSQILKCNSTKCNDIITCLGSSHIEEDMDYTGQYWKSTYNEYYEPLYFYPSLHIINIGSNYPKELSNELITSFSHFFSDLASCANKLRVCVEILMDELRINKTELKSGKRRGLTLHSRILKYKTVNADVADYLLAIKWIGNSGSHFDDLDKADILDAYQLLDFSLKKIYDNETREIKKLTKEINKKRAPRSKGKGKAN